MTNTFWLNDPTILFNKEYITELWPTEKLSLAAKLNAITRTVIILGILGYLVTRSFKIPISAAVTLIILIIIYKTQKNRKKKDRYTKNLVKEGFANRPLDQNTQEQFTRPVPSNPLMNVLLPEISDNPTRNAAAPSFNPVVEEEINESAGNVGIDPRLFVDLGDKLSFENSMRQFHTTANTKITNDRYIFWQR